jgi:hypothetical protein
LEQSIDDKLLEMTSNSGYAYRETFLRGAKADRQLVVDRLYRIFVNGTYNDRNQRLKCLDLLMELKKSLE